ncbi:DnaJ domain protein [Dictyocaulus viviparus]|uniref:DnaJ domain protein n=1 Tax=Dictyocaulus viviparus TaxID=29172 RepID=A0A0D8XID9_DICVI|nr:DnaJ domain protein [Dictyocaulus viviparus]
METAKAKKSRKKRRTLMRDDQTQADTIRMKLPEVLQDEPNRVVTPEPEEIFLSDNDQPSTCTVRRTSLSNIDSLQSSDSATKYEDCIQIVETTSLPKEVSEIVRYPSLLLLENKHSTFISSAPQLDKMEINMPQIAEAPPFYPSIEGLHYEKDKYDLLTEQNLLVFYNNPLYMARDEFVRKFIQFNLVPSGPIFVLLKRLKRLGDEMTVNEVSMKENMDMLSKIFRDCWIVQRHTIETKGKCGENKEASGVAQFSKAVLCTEKVDELKTLLVANRNIILNENLCQEIQFRSITLQVYVSVLYLYCRPEDAQFVLCHLLRLPSPISEWAPPLVQTFIQASSSPKVKIDYCLTMLAHLLNPITGRDSFLRQFTISETDDSTWAILSNDDDEGDFSFITVKECDLMSLFDQLPISELYSLAYLHFSCSATNRRDQFLSLISFQLLLMKVLDSGFSTYCTPAYKLFSKQIGNSLRQSVRELCSFWVIWRNSFRTGEDSQLQKEVDRIMLLTVQYIVSRPSFGLWQFLVDLPFDSVTEECRNRCEYLLRTTNKITVDELYDIPILELLTMNRKTSLEEKVGIIGSQDSVFLVSTLATIMSYSHTDSSSLMKEIVEICFCEESTRESLCKVGSEAIASLLLRRPNTFDQLLTILDRNISHMNNYAANVLTSSNLSGCKLSQTSLSILGKWLINKPPDDSANRMARRIMSSIYWGLNETGEQLWLDPTIHEISADTLIKAHSIHCGSSNGMIAKSIRQVSKLASRMADHENLFNQFCWDILIKVKLSFKECTGVPKSDLTAFFVHIVQNCLRSVDSFLNRGIPLMNELVTAGCSTASVVLLARFIEKYYQNVSSIGSHKGFMELFERILHVDQCSYAIQWLSGPSSVPTPIIRLICSSLTYYSKTVHDMGKYLCAWIDLLCVRRQATWNNDNATLLILGSIVHIAFLADANCLLGIPEVIHRLYQGNFSPLSMLMQNFVFKPKLTIYLQQMLKSWRENSRGILTLFTAEQTAPPLIASSLYGVAPWATYLLLSVESRSYPTFYNSLFEAFVKKDKLTVEDACKRAASKSPVFLSSNRLAVYRWAEFVCVSSESSVFPLVMQNLVMESYRLRIVNGRKYCFARRFLDSSSAQPILVSCRKILAEVADPKGLAKAVSGWLFCSYEVTQTGFDFSVFDLDYLLQLIIGGDMDAWIDFMDNNRLLQENSQDEKLFCETCHLGLKNSTTPIILDHLSSKCYVAAGDNITQEDAKYVDLVLRLYTVVLQQVPVQLRCGFRCSSPQHVTAKVSGTKFDGSVDTLITQNRGTRSAILGELHSRILDKMVVTSASMEHIARELLRMRTMGTSANQQIIQISGRSVFKVVTSSVSGVEMLCPAATAAYEHTLYMLADAFVRMQPEEQIPLMSLILDGFVLSDPLIEAFTPECLSSTELCAAYTCLSEAVCDSERSSRAFKLLKRLAIDKAAASLPPQQFAPLIPLSFQNLVNHPLPDSPLHVLCLEHVVTFIFHAFPSNFGTGLDIALDGQLSSLATIFEQVLHVFSPLIVPLSSSLSPFRPSNDEEAHMVVDRFVQLLIVLPHNGTLQPGTQNLPSLVWQFYFEKLSILSHESSHYYSVIETHFVRIPWHSFYPSQRGLSAMRDCLATKSQYCASFVGQIVVRIHWKDVLTYHIQNEMTPHYLSTLFNVLVRIGSNESNYIKIRASLLDMVKSLSQRSDWSVISPEDTEELVNVVAVCFPYDSLTNPTNVMVILQIIWRKICCFNAREPFTSVALLKQTMWVKTECSLLLREGATGAIPAYSSLIMEVDLLAQQHEDIRAFSVVVQELTSFWNGISDTKFKESLAATWNTYLDKNHESPLVLISLSTLIGSLDTENLMIALKVLEKTIRSYFKRNSFSWEELTRNVQCPSSRVIKVHDYLFSITDLNKTYPLLLTITWFLRFSQQDNVALSLHRFIINIKPKNVWCEASFLLLIWQEVRWLVDSVLAAYANANHTLDERLPSFMNWLNKASKDDSSFISNFISGKKAAYSPRLRTIFKIVELYMTQQMMGETKLPRASEGTPVLNSRINALKEAAANKANQQFAAAFNIATPFFVQVDLHHIGSTPTLVLHCSRALFKEPFLCDTLGVATRRLLDYNLMRLCLVLCTCLVVYAFGSDYPQDPYATLGLSRTANIKEIKRAYKQLAREWHPDKNTSPEAQERFVSISRAYELLSDPLKKERFDRFGTIDDTPQSSNFHHQAFAGFEHFFGGFGGYEDGIFGKQRISLRQYTHSIVERSYYQPFLLYAYSNYCQLCFRLQAQWKAISDDLGPLGYGIGTVNALTDGNLLEKLRISRLPAIVAIVEGRVTHYRSDMFLMSARDVRVFARDVIPRSFMGLINTHDGLSRFVDQWEYSNKISVLVLGASAEPRMRYLLAAMKYSHFARFGYIHLSSSSNEVASIRDDLSIKCKQCENVLIFNDLPGVGPVARLSISNVNQLTMEALNSLIENNKWISLPRISSSEHMDELCPVSSRNPRRLCVILTLMESYDDATFLNSFRMFARQYKDKYADEKVVLTYIYVNRQSEWMKPFLEKKDGENVDKARDVLVIWRIEHVKARFTWLEAAWGTDEEHFKKLLTDVISQTIRLDQTARIGSLINEYAPSWWTRACRTLVRMMQSAWFHLTKEEAYPVLSAVATFLVILIIGYGLNYMNQETKPRKEKKKFTTEEWHPEDPQSKIEPQTKPNPQARLQRALSIMRPHIHELRAESYFGMIRLLKPGCRSLVLLVDEQSKDKLLMQFALYILPLKNNKTFSFGFLMVEKNLPWFRKLLEHTLPLGDDSSVVEGNPLYVKLKSINPRQTVGTVLSLCGWKLYFSIYHPMHTVGKRKHQSHQHFLGFDDCSETTDSDSDNSNAADQVTLRRVCNTVSVENVLNGFPNWLDRLLEGSIRRYYIPEWPDNLR